MDKKTFDLSSTVQMDPPDLKRLQLLLQGSISTQVRPPSFLLAREFLYEMDQSTSVCSLVARLNLALSLAVGKERKGLGHNLT